MDITNFPINSNPDGRITNGSYSYGEPGLGGMADVLGPDGKPILGPDGKTIKASTTGGSLSGGNILDAISGNSTDPNDPTKGTHGATNLLAKVSREQFDQYKKFGYPIENQLLGMVGTPQTGLSSATTLASDTGALNASEENRSLAGYGLAQTADQAATNSRLNSMNTTAAMAGARNAVRQGSKDLDQQILIGAPNDGLPNV